MVSKKSLKGATNEILLKRKLENKMTEEYKNDSRLMEILEQEADLKENEDESEQIKELSILKMKEAQALMEKAQLMDQYVSEKRKKIGKSKERIKKKVLEST